MIKLNLFLVNIIFLKLIIINIIISPIYILDSPSKLL